MLETESELSEELDLLTKAFDDMQVSYKELLKNFDEKCESHTKLLSEVHDIYRFLAFRNSRVISSVLSSARRWKWSKHKPIRPSHSHNLNSRSLLRMKPRPNYLSYGFVFPPF